MKQTNLVYISTMPRWELSACMIVNEIERASLKGKQTNSSVMENKTGTKWKSFRMDLNGERLMGLLLSEQFQR